MESSHAITKILLPSKRNGLLHRPRLVDFLHEHIDRKLLLVSAPAGYGKTSLLIDLAHETTLPVCWYSIDATDSDPKIFLEYIVASLRRQFPDFGSRTMAVLADPSSMQNVAAVVNTLVTEIYEDITGYFILILDDYHTVEESEKINQTIDSFLRLSPENAHLILSSRTLPTQLTLTRLTARQEIAGLGQNDLRFSADEIRSFVKQNYSVDLAEKDAHELAANSEGWITGILLTTQTMWRGLFQHLARTQGPHDRVFSYLASEVFEQQSPELQRLLLDSSILDQLQPSLCNELLEITNSLELFRGLEQKNLFITRLEGDEIWYRYHHLFREFLESRLADTNRTRWETLHRRAAELFRTRGQWDQVVRHHLEIRAFGDAALALEKIARETFDAGHWATLAKWIDALPAKVMDTHPNLIVWRAQLHAEIGDLDSAADLYARALANFKQQNDYIGIGKTLIKQANSLRFKGEYPESIALCERALAILPITESDSIAEAHRLMGISNGRIGNLTTSIEELELALTLYSPTDHFHTALICQDLGTTYRIAGNVGAEKYFEKALENWRRANNSAGLANTLNSIGVGSHRRGDYAGAIETLEKSVGEARKSGQLRVEALTLTSLGDVYRDKGEYPRAQDAYESAFDIARRINEGFLITYSLNALGETLLLSDDLGNANELIQQALNQAKAHHSNYEMGLGHTSLGILNYKKGDPIVAVESLTRASELLDQGGAKRDSARAHLHLAQANYLQGALDKVVEQLKTTADLGRRIGEDQFIVGDSSFVLPVIKYAVSQKIGNGYFADALEKIESLTIPTHGEEPELQTSAAHIQAYALGAVRVVVEGRQISRTDWASNTARELFYLLLSNPIGFRKEEILDALWSEIMPAKANGMFHTSLYRVRRALLPDVLVYENGLYHLNDELDLWYDVTEFNRLIAQSKNSSSEAERISCYRQAIELYRGDYIEDSYSDWCIPIRSDLLTKYLDASFELAKYLGSRSEYQQALDLHQRILAKDPCREEIYQAMMRIQADSGDRNGAIRTFQQCVEMLRKELRVDPSHETRMLFEQILKSKDQEKKA